MGDAKGPVSHYNPSPTGGVQEPKGEPSGRLQIENIPLVEGPAHRPFEGRSCPLQVHGVVSSASFE